MNRSDFTIYKEICGIEVNIEPGPDDIFSLSEEVSEWLFNIRFWYKLNEIHGTWFDQYEEESISEPMISVVIKEMQLLLDNLAKNPNQSFNFSHGWNARLAPLFCLVGGHQVQREISDLIKFFETALSRGLSIECCL